MKREVPAFANGVLLLAIVAGAGFLGGMNFQSGRDAASLQVCQSSLHDAQVSAARYKAIDDTEHPLFDMLVQYIGNRPENQRNNLK